MVDMTTMAMSMEVLALDLIVVDINVNVCGAVNGCSLGHLPWNIAETVWNDCKVGTPIPVTLEIIILLNEQFVG